MLLATLALVTCLRFYPAGEANGLGLWRADQYPSWRDGSSVWETRLGGQRYLAEPWIVRIPTDAEQRVWIGDHGALVMWRGQGAPDLVVLQNAPVAVPQVCAWPSWRVLAPLIGRAT